jgi:hypothetical protein
MADFLLHEGPMGYSVFKVVHQADAIGNRLKEVQESVQDLSRFGKMVSLVSFLPFEYAQITSRSSPLVLTDQGTANKHWKSSMTFLRALLPIF